MTDPKSGTDRWIEATSAFDRVRSVAFALQRPRTAGQIADSAHVSEKTARGHLRRLVEMDLMLEDGGDGPTTYYPDPGYTRYREVRALARDHHRDRLMEMAGTLKGDIERWQDEYDVDDVTQLRVSATDADVIERAVYDRQRAAEDWEYTAYRLDLIRDALEQYDRLTSRPPPAA